MTKDTVVAVLRRHGLDLEEYVIAQAVEETLLLMEPRSRASSLTGNERSLLTEAGLHLDDRASIGAAAAASAGSYAALVADSLTTGEAAEMLGVDPSRVRHRIAGRRLYAVRGTSGPHRLPRFQFFDGRPLPGLERVLEALPLDLHPLEVVGFFTTPQPELELGGDAASVIEWLVSGGDPAPALALARAEMP